MTQALATGLVVATHGRQAMVETPDGHRVLCHTRGKKSDLVVGDRVRWQVAGDAGVVEALEPRRNLLFRQDEWRTKSFAANLDQLLVLVAPEPVFSESQLTRALIAAAEAGIPATIGLNKIDLPSAELARARLAPYVAMGVPAEAPSIEGFLFPATYDFDPGTTAQQALQRLVTEASRDVVALGLGVARIHSAASSSHSTTTTLRTVRR